MNVKPKYTRFRHLLHGQRASWVTSRFERTRAVLMLCGTRKPISKILFIKKLWRIIKYGCDRLENALLGTTFIPISELLERHASNLGPSGSG
jgi:hypothetical protein